MQTFHINKVITVYVLTNILSSITKININLFTAEALSALPLPLNEDNRNNTIINFSLENDSKYLNNFLNISNEPPELNDYYALDDLLSDEQQQQQQQQQLGDVAASILPEIYPDPERILNIDRLNEVNNKKKNISKYHHNHHNQQQQNPFRITTEESSAYFAGDELPQQTRNDEDFKEHDTIDNIMYIYYGTSGSIRKSFGGSVIIIGAVFALGAQILAIIFSMLRNRRQRRQNPLTSISLNLLSSLCASNFVFIVGVQASKTLFKCEMIAILLHYFHLSTSLWGFGHTYTIYDFIINDNPPNLRYNNLLAYGGSGIYVLFSFMVSSSSYETYNYCWMSVQRGMIVNFMIPISVLIVTTTIFGTLTLRDVAAKQREVMVESIENILEKCQHIDTVSSGGCGVVGGGIGGIGGGVGTHPIIEKCCDDMDKVCDTELKRIDFYDSKFDLGALSIADLSLQSSNESQDYAEFKQAVKFSLFFQPAFSVCWFLGVVALENRQSSIMPFAFIICYNILNWYILYRSTNISPFIIMTKDMAGSSYSSGGLGSGSGFGSGYGGGGVGGSGGSAMMSDGADCHSYNFNGCGGGINNIDDMGNYDTAQNHHNHHHHNHNHQHNHHHQQSSMGNIDSYSNYDEMNPHLNSSYTDTIPLLCSSIPTQQSPTATSITNHRKHNLVDDLFYGISSGSLIGSSGGGGGGGGNCDSSSSVDGGGICATSLQEINLWESNMEHVNLECISTISN